MLVEERHLPIEDPLQLIVRREFFNCHAGKVAWQLSLAMLQNAQEIPISRAQPKANF
jgi:hypothetical protein